MVKASNLQLFLKPGKHPNHLLTVGLFVFHLLFLPPVLSIVTHHGGIKLAVKLLATFLGLKDSTIFEMHEFHHIIGGESYELSKVFVVIISK